MDMNETEQQLEQLEISMEQAKVYIDRADTLLRLSKSADFKAIISDGYFVDEASRLVLNIAQPGMSDEIVQKDINNSIIAISYLKRHFNGIMTMGGMAKKSLDDAEATREELLKDAGDA